MIVLSIQQEISTHNSDTYGDYYEDDKDQQHETIDVVHLPRHQVMDSIFIETKRNKLAAVIKTVVKIILNAGEL